MKWQPITMLATGIIAAVVTMAPAVAKKPHKKVATPSASLPKVNYDVVNELKIGGDGPCSALVLDAAGKYLYVAREKVTQIIDTATGKVVAEIPGQNPQGIALVPEVNRGFITNFGGGMVTVFDLKTNAVLGEIAVGGKMQAIIYDPASKRLFVHCGDWDLVPIAADIDLKTGKPEPAISFGARVGGFVADHQGMVYVTTPDNNIISVLDTRTMSVATQWSIENWDHPEAISMDRLHSRLFIGCGARLLILSASDGHMLDGVTMRSTPPWKYLPAVTAYCDGHVFGVCGDGTITVLGQKEDGAFVVEDMAKVEPNSQPVAVDQNSGKVYLPTEQIDAGKVMPGTFKILVLQKK